MARPPKRSRVPYQDIEQIQLWFKANLAASDGMPHNADLRAAIIIALMDRIKSIDPRVHALCKQSIATIANLEVARFVPEERRNSEIAIEIQKIIRGKLSGITHYPPLLRQQRAALLDYFKQEKFDTIKNSSALLLRIRDHWTRIIEFLTQLPCYCGNYVRAYKEFARMAKENAVKTRNGIHRPAQTPVEIIDLLLANLHSTSFENIRKLLKPSA